MASYPKQQINLLITSDEFHTVNPIRKLTMAYVVPNFFDYCNIAQPMPFKSAINIILAITNA